MPSLSIFANFFIDSQENLQRMKDSLLSFRSMPAERWVVNVRGRFKGEAKQFLREHLSEKLVSYELDSEAGWFHDSRVMMESIQTSHVFFWVEDHISLIQDMDVYERIVEDLEVGQVDFMYYSFFWTAQRYAHLQRKSLREISWFDVTRETFRTIVERSPGTYIIGVCGFFRQELFKKIIFSDDEAQAIKWPKMTPFDFEKSSHDVHWLPLRMGVPHRELFASIDDDSIVPGTCLISRGLYPDRVKRAQMGAPTGIKPIRTPS